MLLKVDDREWVVQETKEHPPSSHPTLLLQHDPACKWLGPSSFLLRHIQRQAGTGGQHGCFVSGMRCDMAVPGQPFCAAQRQDMQMHDANCVRPGATHSRVSARHSLLFTGFRYADCCRIMRDGPWVNETAHVLLQRIHSSKLDAGGEQRTIRGNERCLRFVAEGS